MPPDCPGDCPAGRCPFGLGPPGALKRIISVRGRRASISLVPAPQRVVVVRPPLAKRIAIGPGGHAIRVHILRPSAGPRVVIVGPGWRSVHTPRQIRLWLRPGKRLTVVPGGVAASGQVPAPACVIVRPAP